MSITLTLENLPPHQSLGLDFLLAIIDSWDGNERLTITVDGAAVTAYTMGAQWCPCTVPFSRRLVLSFLAEKQ